MACLHLAAATPNHVILEGGGNVAVSKNYLTEPLELLEGGFVAVPDGPGLGFELDEEHDVEGAGLAARWESDGAWQVCAARESGAEPGRLVGGGMTQHCCGKQEHALRLTTL